MFRPTLRGPQHNAEPAEDQNLRRALNGWGFRDSLAGGRHRIRLVWITSAAGLRARVPACPRRSLLLSRQVASNELTQGWARKNKSVLPQVARASYFTRFATTSSVANSATWRVNLISSAEVTCPE